MSVAPARRVPADSAGRNPAADARTVTRPAGTADSRYAPLVSVRMESAVPTTCTCARAIGAPAPSRTVPATCPVVGARRTGAAPVAARVRDSTATRAGVRRPSDQGAARIESSRCNVWR